MRFVEALIVKHFEEGYWGERVFLGHIVMAYDADGKGYVWNNGTPKKWYIWPTEEAARAFAECATRLPEGVGAENWDFVG